VDASLSPQRDANDEYAIRFDQPAKRHHHITRAHPLVESLASHVLQAALDPLLSSAREQRTIASRCGLVQTDAVRERTTVLLLRARYQIETTRRDDGDREPLLAENVFALAFEGDLATPRELPPERAAELVDVTARANFDPARAERLLTAAVGSIPHLEASLAQAITSRATALASAHDAARSGRKPAKTTKVSATGRADILGLYILMPHAPNGLGVDSIGGGS
jgi:hypothetical protein